MNRLLRNSLFLFFGFLVGVLAVGIPTMAHAETTAATYTNNSPFSSYKYSIPEYACNNKSSAQEACTCAALAASPSATSTVLSQNTSNFQCQFKLNGNNWMQFYGGVFGSCPVGMTATGGVCVGYTCPTGQNWTLSGTSCTRPDCVAPETRDPATGLCAGPPPCTVAANGQLGSTRYAFPYPQPSGVTWCINNCTAYPNMGASSNTVGGTTYAYALVNGAGGSASSCVSSGSNTPIATADPTTTADPPCAAGSGVMSNPEGKVVCVPQGTPGATNPPVVNKKSTPQTNPDGSQTITTVTQTCTGDGACNSVTSTTITSATAGGPGTAGTPGTTISNADKPNTNTPGFCAENPGLQICKGGISEEATQLKVEKNTKDTLDEIKKFSSPTVSDASPIEGNTFENTTGRQDLTDKDNELKSYASGSLVDSGVTSSKSAWESAMLDGWWEPIDLGACAPFQMTFAGRTVVIDHCEKAALISQIGAYGMWIMLLIGSFVMLTGGRNN